MAKNLFESEEPKIHLINAVNYLATFLENGYSILVPKEIKKIAVDKVLEHYKLHIDTYNVTVNGIDPYKVYSWLGLYLYEEALEHNNSEVSDAILKATIICMNRALHEEGRTLPKFYLKKIFNMVKSDFNGKTSLGIRKNGLYLTFRSASLCSFVTSDIEIESESDYDAKGE